MCLSAKTLFLKIKMSKIRKTGIKGIWWSRGELNPRPQALCNQFYMRSRFI